MTSADMDNVYVRKDVFYARMDRMETLLEKTLTEIKADNTQLRSNIKALSERVDQNFAFLNMRIDSLQTSVYWIFAAMSIIIALVTFLPAIGKFLKNLHQPQITMDDVEKAIDAAIKRTSASV